MYGIWDMFTRLLNSNVRVIHGAGVPVDGTTGVLEGAGKGALYIDITNAKLYINGGTLAAPVWKIVTSAA